MNRIRIWFKDEYYSSYFENVISWEFDGDFFKFLNDEGGYYIDTKSIKQLLIGPMKEEGEHDTGSETN